MKNNKKSNTLNNLFAKIPMLRILKFGLVGCSGVIVNMGILFLGKHIVHLDVAIASPIAIIVSIFTNFLLNYYWTWNEQTRKQSFFRQLLKYYVSSSLGALINYGTLLGMNKLLGVNYLISNLSGIILAMSSNFLLSEFWVFKKQ